MNEGGHMASSGQAAESCGKDAAPPIDQAHFERQTMGDAALQAEVLGLLAEQMKSVRAAMSEASPAERAALAHGLKGAARGIGAFSLADCSDAVEKAPDLDETMNQLNRQMDVVLEFIACKSIPSHGG